jgi:hypothetical protein
MARRCIIVLICMAVIGRIAGAILVLFGAIWFLQGINVLPGSFMTGQIRWAVYGGIAVAAGVTLLLIAKRRKPSKLAP